MPGPKATNRKSRPDTGTTDPRARARLKRRQDVFVPENKENHQRMHMPGSENRKKR